MLAVITTRRSLRERPLRLPNKRGHALKLVAFRMIHHRAYVGMGSNLGNREQTLSAAFDALDTLPGTRVARRSSIYVTAPIDPNGDQQDYYNAVAALDTGLDPHPLLDALQQIELRAGRTREPGIRNTSRTLDLDLLLYDDLELDEFLSLRLLENHVEQWQETVMQSLAP